MSKVVAVIADINRAGMGQHDGRFRPRLRAIDGGKTETSKRELESTKDRDEPLSQRTTVISWIALATLSWALLLMMVVTLWHAL